jgi:hypothetical protein
MARPALLVDSGALIALANRRETANPSVNRVLADFFGELVTTWPAVTEACHMIPDHLAPRLGRIAGIGVRVSFRGEF